jgi:antirestriction protein ArdC
MRRDDALKLATKGYEELAKALAEGRSETLTRYLAVMGRFHNYSFRNCMMIAMQQPDATQVAGYRKWEQLGRQVKKGEKGIGIFAPLVYRKKEDGASNGNKAKDDGKNGAEKTLQGFRVVHVFDVSQTDGKALPEFAQVNGDPGKWLARLESVVRTKGIELEYVDSLGGAQGVSTGGKVQIVESLDAAEKFITLVHEASHELLHRGSRRNETTKKVRETEAEAVGFVVAQAIGLDAVRHAADYIDLYRGNTDTLSESMEFIQKTATDLIEALDAADVCEHSLSAYDQAGRLQGNWSESQAGNRIRV